VCFVPPGHPDPSVKSTVPVPDLDPSLFSYSVERTEIIDAK
jgi:hypothetical protein